MKLLPISIVLLFFPFLVNGQDNNNFKGGEKLKFVLYYGLVDAGYVDSELKMINFEGRTVYHSVMVAKTTGIADKLYKVRDEYQSWFDPASLLPVKSLRDIHEGKYTKYDYVSYQHKNRIAINDKNDSIPVPVDVRDMIATFYYVRNLDFSSMKDGQIIKNNTFFDNELFPFDMRYRGKETIKTRAGSFKCIKLVPFVEPGRIFHNEDDMTIWISDDRNRVPVRVRFDLKVGSIKADLIEYSGLKY